MLRSPIMKVKLPATAAASTDRGPQIQSIGPDTSSGSTTHSELLRARYIQCECWVDYTPITDANYPSNPVSETYAAVPYNALLEKVGRNRTYTLDLYKAAIGDAANRFAVLVALRSVIAAKKRNPDLANVAFYGYTSTIELQDVCDDYEVILRTSRAVPKALAEQIKRDFALIYDKNGKWEENLMILRTPWAVIENTTTNGITVAPSGNQGINMQELRTWLFAPAPREYAQVARDLLDKCECVTTVPTHEMELDNGGHLALLNTFKATDITYDNATGSGYLKATNPGPNSIKWDTDLDLTLCVKDGAQEIIVRDFVNTDAIEPSAGLKPIAVCAPIRRIAVFTDSEEFDMGADFHVNPVDAVEQSANSAAFRRCMIGSNYMELFGGMSVRVGTSPTEIWRMNIEPLGTQTVSMSPSLFYNQVKLYAFQEMYALDFKGSSSSYNKKKNDKKGEAKADK